jgi:Coenzyme PQQ synthesis protein D (PqqD)
VSASLVRAVQYKSGSIKEGTRASLDTSEEQILTRSRSVVARVVGGETLIVPIRGKVGDLASIYSLNETGSLIWKVLEHPTTLSQLVAAVANEFEVDTEVSARDVQEFVGEMKSVGLVEVPTPEVVNQERPVGREGHASLRQ